MNASRYATRLLNSSGLAVVVGALLAGGAAAEESDPENGIAPIVEQSDTASGGAFPPDLMSGAADEAQRIEKRRIRRARLLAQRSSGQMFTPTRNYENTAFFGQPGARWSAGYHTGLDFAAPVGTPVFAALAGKVVKAGWGGAYGNYVVIKHDGTKTLYAHLNSIAVEDGQKVLRGERIGAVGSTGNSSGPHLHFEVLKDGDQRDPAKFL